MYLALISIFTAQCGCVNSNNVESLLLLYDDFCSYFGLLASTQYFLNAKMPPKTSDKAIKKAGKVQKNTKSDKKKKRRNKDICKYNVLKQVHPNTGYLARPRASQIGVRPSAPLWSSFCPKLLCLVVLRQSPSPSTPVPSNFHFAHIRQHSAKGNEIKICSMTDNSELLRIAIIYNC